PARHALPTTGSVSMTTTPLQVPWPEETERLATAVRVTDVSRVFASKGSTVVALDHVDLTVEAGEFVSLIGPSGCGRSTLLRIIAGLDQPASGTVEVFGKPAKAARLDHAYGIAFQQAGLLPWRTVAANIELPLALHGVG